ncbi:hypothetical protein TWF481_008031 [Arthrobotrys musiformis]|uniref:RecA family profile 1 domain-containing protein n=1 Tax=Arthrobotrys musiformis TaxID=47236 RepID=A0AAV9W5X4_9PEZI
MDLITVLPSIYRTNPGLKSLLMRHGPAFDASGITTVDLMSVDVRELCQRARISLGDLRRIVEGVRDGLNAETLGGPVGAPVLGMSGSTPEGVTRFRGRNMEALGRRQRGVGVWDDGVDGVLGGGVYTGALVEVVGESGVGKTQFLLRLCFSIQQPPHNKSAIYICTESQISTKRMVSMLDRLVSDRVPGFETLSMGRIHTAMCQYLETLEHIVKYQLPSAIEKFGAGLIVIDSIAANFRVDDAEDDNNNRPKGRSAKLARRAGDIVRLGLCLKEMAVKYNVAIVVANQVSDTFEPAWKRHVEVPSSAIVASVESTPATQRSVEIPLAGYSLPTDELMMTYDYQAKWFNGWGEEVDINTVHPGGEEDEVLIQALKKLKTPMLGMTWTNLLDARVALVKGVARREAEWEGEEEDGEGRTRRWVKVVFAPWVQSGVLLEYEIWEGGVRSVRPVSNSGEEGG